MNIFSSKYSFYIFFGVIVCFVLIVKLPYINLPYYWDEAWSYIPAIKTMADHGIGSFFNGEYADIYKGHPILFFAISALWMKIISAENWVMHILPLIMSFVLLKQIYKLGKETFGQEVGIVAMILFTIQSVFLAQSSFLLPEVALTLFSVMTIRYYLSQKYLYYVLSGILLVLTKESGMVLIGALLIHYLYKIIFSKTEFKKSIGTFIKELLIYALPFIIIAIHFLLTKIIYGWFFYPDHIGFIETGISPFLPKLESYSAYLFIYYGRNIVTIAMVIMLGLIVIKRKRIVLAEKNILMLFVSFILLFLIFSSFNFFSPRYILCLFPLFSLIAAYLIKKVIEHKSVIRLGVYILIIAAPIYYSLFRSKDNDHNLGYVNTVQVYQEIVNYCIQKKWHDKTIQTQFLMLTNLTESVSGYLNESKVFSKISSSFTDDTEFIIVTSTEKTPDQMNVIETKNYTLLKRFIIEESWGEVYKR